jgi:hypothetical protein
MDEIRLLLGKFLAPSAIFFLRSGDGQRSPSRRSKNPRGAEYQHKSKSILFPKSRYIANNAHWPNFPMAGNPTIAPINGKPEWLKP